MDAEQQQLYDKLEYFEGKARRLGNSLFMWRMSTIPGGTEAPARKIHREYALRELRAFIDAAGAQLLPDDEQRKA